MGKFYRKLINNQQGIPYLAGPKREGIVFSGMVKLKRVKSIKSSKFFFLFHLIIFYLKRKKKIT